MRQTVFFLFECLGNVGISGMLDTEGFFVEMCRYGEYLVVGYSTRYATSKFGAKRSRGLCMYYHIAP
jgi:hypothetical protein